MAVASVLAWLGCSRRSNGLALLGVPDEYAWDGLGDEDIDAYYEAKDKALDQLAPTDAGQWPQAPVVKFYRALDNIGIRKEPDVGSDRTGAGVIEGDVFEVIEETKGSDGRVYLKLRNEEGWVFDRGTRGGLFGQLIVEAVEEVELLQRVPVHSKQKLEELLIQRAVRLFHVYFRIEEQRQGMRSMHSKGYLPPNYLSSFELAEDLCVKELKSIMDESRMLAPGNPQNSIIQVAMQRYHQRS